MYVSMRNFETIPISRLILITPILPLIHNINITRVLFVRQVGMSFVYMVTLMCLRVGECYCSRIKVLLAHKSVMFFLGGELTQPKLFWLSLDFDLHFTLRLLYYWLD